MKILITGGSGFVGKNLREYLSDRHEVCAPSHSELELLDKKSVDSFFEGNKFDVVVHSAVRGGSRRFPSYPDMLKDNLRMFFNIAANSKSFKKMIFIGSGAEYDKSKDILKVKEEDFGKSIPPDDYGFFKYVCSKYIENTENIINLRVFGAFGKYEDYDTRFISNILCRIIFDLPVEINQNAVYDFIYVEDLCRIIEYFILNDSKYKFYNVGSEKPCELVEILEIIKTISGKNFDVKIKKDGLNKEYTCDNSRLMRELKNFNFMEIDKAINSLYSWYEQNKIIIKKDNLLIY